MAYSPAQVAKVLGMTAQSVRNWSRDYAALLSPTARGDAGQRAFNDQDLDVLRNVVALRRSGLPPAEILTRLQGGVPPVVDAQAQAAPEGGGIGDPEVSPGPAPGLKSEFRGLNDDQATRWLVASSQQALLGRLDALERAQAQQTRQRWAVGLVFCLGAVFGLLLAAFLLWAAWLLVNGGI